MKDGKTTPIVAQSAPRTPDISIPVKVAILTANGPGVLSDIAIKSNSISFPIQPFAVISLIIRGIIAWPPPIVNSPILKKVQNNSK